MPSTREAAVGAVMTVVAALATLGWPMMAASVESPSQTIAVTGPPAPIPETIAVRLELDDLWVEPAGPVPDVSQASAAEDWILEGELVADDVQLRDACRAVSRTTHSRFIRPDGLTFSLRFDAQEADCAAVPYLIRVIAYAHATAVPIDFNGDPAAPPCPRLPLIPAALAEGCFAVIPFDLNGRHAEGATNGTWDNPETPLGGVDHALEVDGGFHYALDVVASTVDLGFTLQPLVPWLVRVEFLNLTLHNPTTLLGKDMFFDAELGPADGSGGPGCRAQARSPHPVQFRPDHVDLVLRDGDACRGSDLELHLIGYGHNTDGMLDLDGESPPEDVCTPLPTPLHDVAGPCDLRLRVPLVDGYASPDRFADGRDDGIGRPPGEAARSLLENDARLEYRVTVQRAFEQSVAHLRLNLTYTGPNVNALPVLDSWQVDAEATGAPGCIAQVRAPHSHFIRHGVIDLAFRGRGAATCLESPLRIDLAAYEFDESRIDLNGARPPQGRPCPRVLPIDQQLYSLDPALEERFGRLVYGDDCAIALAWDPTRDARAGGRSDGWEDGFLADTTDARIDWTLRAG